MAFIATVTDQETKPQTLGTVRAIGDPDNTSAEFAISVRSDLKGQGLGSAQLDKVIRYCRGKGAGELFAQVLPGSRPMLALAARHHFEKKRLPGDDVLEIQLGQ